MGGELCINDQTTEVEYLSQEQMDSMDAMDPIYQQVADACAAQEAAYVRRRGPRSSPVPTARLGKTWIHPQSQYG